MILHRYEARTSCSVDEWDNVCNRQMHLYHHKYHVVKETPKGWWIYTGFWFETSDPSTLPSGKWVGKDHRKQYACPTEELALQSLMARKVAHMRILQSKMDDAQWAYNLAHAKLVRTQHAGGIDAHPISFPSQI